MLPKKQMEEMGIIVYQAEYNVSIFFGPYCHSLWAGYTWIENNIWTI